MAVSELNLVGRAGRSGKALSLQVLGELTARDVDSLREDRGTAPAVLKKLRDRHHSAARLLAQGMDNAQIAAITGYDPARISIFKSDPSFQDLIQHYRRVENSLEADFAQRAESIALTAMNEIADRLEDEEAAAGLSVPTLLEITKVMADRAGHAPEQRNFNTNVNIGTGRGLSGARERLQQLRQQRPSEVPEDGE